MPVDYAIGICDRCGRPVVKPECIIEGMGRCLCPEPDLWTWDMLDAEYRRDKAERDRKAAESPYQPRDNFRIWKKRAKNL